MTQEETLKAIDFPGIRERLASCCAGSRAQQQALHLKPLDHLESVRTALTEVGEAVLLLQRYPPSVYPLPDLQPVLQRAAQGGLLDGVQLRDILRLLQWVAMLLPYAAREEVRVHAPLLCRRLQELVDGQVLRSRLVRSVGEDGQLLDTASAALGTLRRQIRESERRIRQQLDTLLTSGPWREALQERIVTMREDHFVLPVKQEARHRVDGIELGESSTGQTVYIEPTSIVRLENELKRLRAEEAREEERVLRELSSEIGTFAGPLTLDVELLTWFDFTLARGALALQMNAVVPQLTFNGTLRLEGVRHPLIEHDRVVPIDLYLDENRPTLVISGPNTGGKTVALKSVGLLVAMAHAGLAVPAKEEALLPWVESIWADIGDRQSIAEDLSTFSAHMVQIAAMLRQARSPALVLLDEVGAGTDPDEGAAIAVAVLETLHHRGLLTVATTHYPAVKAWAAAQAGARNAAVSFDTEQLKPTYHLVYDVSGSSSALVVAERLGLPAEVIALAKAQLNREKLRLDALMLEMTEAHQQAMEDRLKAQREQQQAERALHEVQQMRQQLERERERYLRQAREDALLAANRARQEIETMLIQLREKAKTGALREHELTQARSRLQEQIASYFPSTQTVPKSSPQVPQPGEQVFVRRGQVTGEVLSVSGNEVVVQAGPIRLQVPVEEVERRESSQKRPSFSPERGRKRHAIAAVPAEIDVRGKTAAEAQQVVARYLTDARAAGLHEVRIIHGKGTGALRQALHQSFKNDPNVAGYRLGSWGEGDFGVTVVTLRS